MSDSPLKIPAPRTVWTVSRGEYGEGATVYSIHETEQRAIEAALGWVERSFGGPWVAEEPGRRGRSWACNGDHITIERFEVKP